MYAYNSNPETKTAILAQLEAHRAADEIVKGRFWGKGKGCAVDCTIYSGNHAEYETHFGIPQMLAHLEDSIFKGLPNLVAKDWPIRFMSAIKPGQDLSLVGWKFLHWILTDETVNPGITHPLVKDAVAQAAQVICAIAKREPPNEKAAWSAAWRAESVAWRAANMAWSVESAAKSAESAAKSAAWSAESVVRSAESAARSVENAAWSAANAARSADWNAAKSAAWRAAYVLMADTLIELIETAS